MDLDGRLLRDLIDRFARGGLLDKDWLRLFTPLIVTLVRVLEHGRRALFTLLVRNLYRDVLGLDSLLGHKGMRVGHLLVCRPHEHLCLEVGVR